MFNRIRHRLPVPQPVSAFSRDVVDAELPAELQEVYDAWSQTGQAASLKSGPAAESEWPVSIFVPERYEQNYAYPLVIWFHSDGADENELEDVMHSVSPQNYIGLSLRGNAATRGPGYRWKGDGLQFGALTLQNLLHVTACRMRRAFHIHSERIFVAGADSGAAVALQMLADQPDWFAGAVLLNPAWSASHSLPQGLQSLRGKPVLHCVSRATSDHNLAGNVEIVRGLRSAGARLTVELFDENPDVTSGEVRFVDHWLMGQLNRPALV